MRLFPWTRVRPTADLLPRAYDASLRAIDFDGRITRAAAQYLQDLAAQEGMTLPHIIATSSLPRDTVRELTFELLARGWVRVTIRASAPLQIFRRFEEFTSRLPADPLRRRIELWKDYFENDAGIDPYLVHFIKLERCGRDELASFHLKRAFPQRRT